jgi:hypothetical protein
MTVDERFEQLERKTQRLEKRNERLTVALVMVVTMAPSAGEKDGEFDSVMAKNILVKNDAGEIVVSVGATDSGHGVVYTKSAKGKDLVELGSTEDGGSVVYNKTDDAIAMIIADEYGNGKVTVLNPNKFEFGLLRPGHMH